MTLPVVLLVEEDDTMSGRLERWLEDDGYAVLRCRGPSSAVDRCPAAGNEVCPLAEVADAVVLDVRFDADAVMEGIPGWQLLDAYRATGKPIVALAGNDERMELDGDVVVVVARTTGRYELSAALRDAAVVAPGPIDVALRAGVGTGTRDR